MLGKLFFIAISVADLVVVLDLVQVTVECDAFHEGRHLTKERNVFHIHGSFLDWETISLEQEPKRIT